MADQRARGANATRWTVVGIVLGTAPGWLFAIAALANMGPRTASLVFAIPVLLATAVAIWISVRLIRRGRRSAGIAVGGVALVVGVIAYVAWVYLFALGMQFGNGPY